MEFVIVRLNNLDHVNLDHERR